MTEVMEASRRLNVIALVVVSVMMGVALTLGPLFRVADCGPADPQFLRYLGGPFFLHSTGVGFSSSMEARIWIAPFSANVAAIAALFFVYFGLRSRPKSRRTLKICIVAGLAVILILLALAFAGNDVQWALSGPPVAAEACDIRFAFFPDQQAWQTPPDP